MWAYSTQNSPSDWVYMDIYQQLSLELLHCSRPSLGSEIDRYLKIRSTGMVVMGKKSLGFACKP